MKRHLFEEILIIRLAFKLFDKKKKKKKKLIKMICTERLFVLFFIVEQFRDSNSKPTSSSETEQHDECQTDHHR